MQMLLLYQSKMPHQNIYTIYEIYQALCTSCHTNAMEHLGAQTI